MSGDASASRSPDIVSVVMPCLDGGRALDEQLAALAAQDYEGEWEFVLSDNGSRDGSGARALAWSDRLPSVRVVDASGRRGINHARNVGVAAAAGNWILICDADDRVAPDWMTAMASALCRGSDVVGGYLELEALNEHPGSPGHDGLADWIGFLPWAPGANLGFRAEVHSVLGGFDERYVFGGEDTEFSWRAQLAGFRLSYVRDAVVHYRIRPDTRSLARQYYLYGRAVPRLYRDFRNQGMKPSSPVQALRTCGYLLLHAPELLSGPERRRRWVKAVALRWGHLRGSIAERVLYL
jgi:GT2 family glycosyltransferase